MEGLTMCIALPAQIVAVDSTGATVETTTRHRRASTSMFPDIREGEWVLVAAGTIVSRLSPDEANEIGEALRATMRLEGSEEETSSHANP